MTGKRPSDDGRLCHKRLCAVSIALCYCKPTEFSLDERQLPSTQRILFHFQKTLPNFCLSFAKTFFFFFFAAANDSSVGKESACNAGDPGSIPGLGRSTGERIGYQFQYSWASFVAQLVKNLPAMWQT